jgi:hypothetical protein
MCLQNAAANRQSQPAAVDFCGEERLEHLVSNTIDESRSAVSYAYNNFAIIDYLRLDLQCTRLRCIAHRIHAVVRKVQQHLLNLDRIDADGRNPGIEVKLYRNPAASRLFPQQFR